MSKYLEKPSKYLFSVFNQFKNKPILNYLNKNFQNFPTKSELGNIEVPKSSYLPFWKIAALAPLVIWDTLFKWEIPNLDCFVWHRVEHCFNKIARKTQG